MTEDFKRKREEARSTVKKVMDSLEQLSKEELESIREKLGSVEESMDQAKEDAKMDVKAILSSLETMGREEIASVKAKIDELKQNQADEPDEKTGEE
jgi:ElaB/YqjD/DUF883 family membrane-anchored ribosome-binding protein